jgi:hypothetical protein
VRHCSAIDRLTYLEGQRDTAGFVRSNCCAAAVRVKRPVNVDSPKYGTSVIPPTPKPSGEWLASITRMNRARIWLKRRMAVSRMAAMKIDSAFEHVPRMCSAHRAIYIRRRNFRNPSWD